MYEVNHWGQLSLFRIESKKTRGITPLFCFVVTRKIIKKSKKMIKSVDRDHKRVYNITINQIQGNATKAQ